MPAPPPVMTMTLSWNRAMSVLLDQPTAPSVPSRIVTVLERCPWSHPALVESVLFSLLRRIDRCCVGAAITAGYASEPGWTLSIPVTTLAAGVGASLVLRALGGLYPATRAARLAPATAIKPT